MLTQAQFETLDALFGRLDQSRESFEAYEVFAGRDNEDNGHRRTLNGLASKGLLERVGKTSQYRIPSWDKLLDANQSYRRKHNVWD